MGIPDGAIVPPQDTTFDVPCSLTLSGSRIRYLREGRSWSGNENAYVVRPRLEVFDGETGKTLAPSGTGYTYWPHGSIVARNPTRSTLQLTPVLLAIRACDSALRPFSIQAFTATGRYILVENRRCPELHLQSGMTSHKLWVDPSRDYVPIRFISATKDVYSQRWETQYRRDPDAGWIPEAWTIHELKSDGSIERSFRARMKAFRVNADTESGEFGIVFPSGTRVADVRDPSSPSHYIVKDGDQKRAILREDIGATYDQMLNSGPGEARGKGKLLAIPWSVAIPGAVAAFAVALLLRRRRIPGWRR
jgi:hypothetical protein